MQKEEANGVEAGSAGRLVWIGRFLKATNEPGPDRHAPLAGLLGQHISRERIDEKIHELTP